MLCSSWPRRLALAAACSLAPIVVTPPAEAKPIAHAAALGPHASFVLEHLASGVLAKIGGDAFGHSLEAIGLGRGTDPQLDAVSRQLSDLNARLANVEDHVHRIEASVAYGRLDAVRARAAPLLSDITTMTQRLAEVAGDDYADEAVRRSDARKLAKELATLTESKQHLLNEIVHSMDGSGSDDIISAGDRAERSHGRRFWDAEASNDVRTLVFFYEAKQAQLLLLRVEYETVGEPGQSEAARQDHIRQAQRMTTHQTARFHSQEAAMPAPVPAGPANGLPYGHVVIDTRANRFGHHLVWVYRRGVHAATFLDPTLHGHQLPDNEDYRFLVAGRGGLSPAEYLTANRWPYPLGCEATEHDTAAGRTTAAGGRTFFTRDLQYVGYGNSVFGGGSSYNRFSFQITHEAFHQDQHQGCLMFVRGLRPDEHYWWAAS